jgi:tetratricopeptide (TPR) repeat protein
MKRALACGFYPDESSEVGMSDYFYSAPKEPNGKSVSIEEAEKILLERLSQTESELERAMMDLVIFYGRTGRQELSLPYLQRLLNNTGSPEKKALYLLKLGQLMEQLQNFEAAITFYSQAFSLEPVNREVWYFINNNLGYCLNHFGRCGEAEAYCRAAIQVDPGRQNAYKNLGISLEGLGQFAAAARSYIQAVQTNPADPRALRHLEKLASGRPELAAEIPDLSAQIEKCREAVMLVQKMRGE